MNKKTRMSVKIFLKKGKTKPMLLHHPWVFSNSIKNIKGQPQDGDIVNVFDNEGRFIGKGFFNSKSLMQVRILSWDIKQRVDNNFFKERILNAVKIREHILKLKSKTSVYRLIHNEGDSLPGLTIDKYNDIFVVQLSSLGMHKRRHIIFDILKNELSAKTIIEKACPKNSIEGIDVTEDIVHGKSVPEDIVVREYGLKFKVNLLKGQKTGFYIDQRENRLKSSFYGYDRRVLDAFCYSGSFGVYLADKGNAKEVVFMDSSKFALGLAESNVELNRHRKCEYIKADIFKELCEMQQGGEIFDLIILDPPKVAPRRKDLKKAILKLEDLNKTAIQMLSNNGILISCDCSGDISREDFAALMNRAAIASGKRLNILEITSAGADHPANLACPENIYLKVIFGVVSNT